MISIDPKGPWIEQLRREIVKTREIATQMRHQAASLTDNAIDLEQTADYWEAVINTHLTTESPR